MKQLNWIKDGFHLFHLFAKTIQWAFEHLGQKFGDSGVLALGRQFFGAINECTFFDLCTPYLSTFLSESVFTLVLEGST